MHQDIEPVALTYIMEFMYCGVVEVPKKRLEAVLHVAKQLQIKGLYNTSNRDRNKTSTPSLITIESRDDLMYDFSEDTVVYEKEDNAISEKLMPQNETQIPKESFNFRNVFTEDDDQTATFNQETIDATIRSYIGTLDDNLEEIQTEKHNPVSNS